VTDESAVCAGIKAGMPVGIAGFLFFRAFFVVVRQLLLLLLLLLHSSLLTQYCAGGKIKKNELGRACGAYGGGDRCAQDFGGEA
jgi:hypothetical protein